MLHLEADKVPSGKIRLQPCETNSLTHCSQSCQDLMTNNMRLEGAITMN